MDPRELEYDVLRRMTPAEQLTVLRALIREAYRLKAAGIRAARPDLSEPKVLARARELVGGGAPEVLGGAAAALEKDGR